MKDETTADDANPKKREPLPPFIFNIIRTFGAGLMVFGSMVAFNTGGITEFFIRPDGTFEYIMGGVFFAVGLFEFLAMPKLMVKIRNLDN